MFLVTRSADFIHTSSATAGGDWDLCHQAVSIQAKEIAIFHAE